MIDKYNVKRFKKLTLPGVGDGEGVKVEVVLPLDDVLRPRDDRCGVIEELPLVEELGDVVLDMVRNADGTVVDLLWKENLVFNYSYYLHNHKEKKFYL